MSDHIFRNQQSYDFWEECQARIPALCSEIALEILCTLDALGHTTSVRSRYDPRGEYALQGNTSLLEHSIHVTQICLSLSDDLIVRNLAVVAGLGHDLGKLELVHRGEYTAVMHAHWGAEHVSRLIGGRLVDRQTEAIVNAIRNHHIVGKGAVHRVLRMADALARGRELQSAMNRIVESKGGRK